MSEESAGVYGARLRVLQLVGSPTSVEMDELSRVYARGCVDALGGEVDFMFAHVSPDGSWRLPPSLSQGDIAAAPALRRGEALARLDALPPGQAPDLALPQMFCNAGMTDYRGLLDVMGLPYLGNGPVRMALGADKALARAVVAAQGVRVPPAWLVPVGGVVPAVRNAAGEAPEDAFGNGGDGRVELPVVVKPAVADNSDGVSLVETEAELAAAVALAHTFSDPALIERFIAPGRELRCAVIEWQGALRALPPEEYPVSAEHPVRLKSDKLGRARDGSVVLAAKTRAGSWVVDGADPVVPALHEAAIACYRALGCRHYGLFDFRVDDDGRPWFLEAGLYCSFSRQSVVATVAEAAGIGVAELFSGLAAQLLGGNHPAGQA